MEEKNLEFAEKSDVCIGSVKIADDVVGSIAAIAASEIEGVKQMAVNVPTELLDKVGVKSANRGVKVVVTGKNVKVDLAVVMEYGYSIPMTCQKIQERVKNSIENMTGLTVTDVNVKISGINVNNK